MSPEQAAARPMDGRSDVFSFGVVLHEALAGHRPFVAASDPDVLHAILHAAPNALPNGIPLPLRLIVERTLEKDPADRFQSMRDLVIELRRILRQGVETAVPAGRAPRRGRWPIAIASTLAIGAAAAGAWFFANRSRRATTVGRSEYTALTNFADSVNSPALSPDGRMLAFIRGEQTVGGPGDIYVKLLPDGEPVQLTHDNWLKASPTFSLDGTRIAYTTSSDNKMLDTWVVPVLGGQPRPLLTNASGLTWIPEPRSDPAGPPLVMFSQFTGRGYQMSIVASTESRAALRTVYLPSSAAGMAHRSYLSPDGRQVLVIEMDYDAWLPCRVVPFDGSSPGHPVGPASAQCTDAAWSPDGAVMYFSANTGSGYHIWRQRFPDGTPEQVTAGATQEEGVHLAPDGRSFVTAIGSRQSTVWIHTTAGDRQLTSEGFAYAPVIAPDGRSVYYLVRTGNTLLMQTGGLWTLDIESGRRQRLLPDFQIGSYALSGDGRRVVFVAANDKGKASAWVARLDGREPPRRLITLDSASAFFGASGEIVLDRYEGSQAFLYRLDEATGALAKISETAMLVPFGVSPDGQWVAAGEGPSPDTRDVVRLYPIHGGSPITVCRCWPPPSLESGPMPPPVSWTPDGRFVVLKIGGSTFMVPLAHGRILPPLPAAGLESRDAAAALPGARRITDQEWAFAGPTPFSYTFMKLATQRNIYRVPVP
jgi:Tol biopolymer transport system component